MLLLSYIIGKIRKPSWAWYLNSSCMYYPSILLPTNTPSRLNTLYCHYCSCFFCVCENLAAMNTPSLLLLYISFLIINCFFLPMSFLTTTTPLMLHRPCMRNKPSFWCRRVSFLILPTLLATFCSLSQVMIVPLHLVV